MMRAKLSAIFAILGLAACMGPGNAPPDGSTRLSPASIPLPPARTFSGGQVEPLRRSNAEMTSDIADLVFRMESGRQVPQLSRFEGPITVSMTGTVPPMARHDLTRLLGRIRTEAGLDISETSGPAAITIEFMSRRALHSYVPNAACFVAPGVSSWAEFRRARRSLKTDWTTLESRKTAAVFIPADTAPQEVRDCLHEELAQALGPLNDLYRLPDSVFNDDNMHGVLTAFDMLTLRAIYSPELSSGMSEAEVRMRLPGIVERLNPAGGPAGSGRWRDDTPRSFISGIETAIGGGRGVASRRDAAIRAANLAEGAGWGDGRCGFAHLIVGRLALASDPALALSALSRAQQIYDARGMALQSAHVDMQLAAFALSQGDAAGALARVDRAEPVAIGAENAGLLASLLMVRSEALKLSGQQGAAQQARMDSLGWARYGFGSESEVRAREAEIAALNPASRRSGP